MPHPHLTAALCRLAPDDTPDGVLLARYVGERDEEAFAALVRRHGGMVQAVCRRVLGNDADADDAVQATFLVLVRKAGSIRERSGLASWLFGVARNVALKARQTRDLRRAKEMGATPRPPDVAAFELAELLHAELARLPTVARGVVILCDLEGLTIAQAANRLGIPPGTAASRLARGRRSLAKRLAGRGLAVAGGLLPAALFGGTAQAVSFDAGAVSESVHTLADEVLQAMNTIPKVTKLVLVLAAVGLTVVAWGQDPPKTSPPAVKTPGSGAGVPAEPAKERTSPIRFKYVPLGDGKTSDTLFGTALHLEGQAIDGWEFCGSLDMNLHKSEYEALLAGKQPGGTTGNEPEKVYRVLVFKQPARR